MGSLEFCSPVLGKLLCSCLCFYDAVVELQTMNGKIFNDFLIGKSKWILYVIKAFFNS